MNKIINSFYINAVYVLFFLSVIGNTQAQDSPLNKYGLKVISSITAYQSGFRQNTGKQMVDLKKLIPTLQFDLRYAGKNNFTNTRLYPPLSTSFLRQPVAMALAEVQKELAGQGLGLKIFDAYRPYAVTEKMWEIVPDDRYAANPKNGSGHNRGISVDLTLVNLRTKLPLDMGTDFDNFTDTAHIDFTGLSQPVLKNRILLQAAMERHGFKVLATEWWHFTFVNNKDFELLNLSFEELKKTQSP